ncbi:MAG: hypothetical protein LBS01_08015 [Prevotellaceae bacterium]|jgi:hypothetical protein|nr:hypothetical protein [Prevotellaceae bacterium]
MEERAKKKSSVRSIPNREADLITASSKVVARWKSADNLTLLWTTASRFEQQIKDFAESFEIRAEVKSERSASTYELKVLNAVINGSLQFVKNYLADRYGKADSVAHYSEFGIVKIARQYGMPRDNDRRLQSLRQLVAAISAPEFTDKKYGTAYWKDILTRFEKEKAAAESIDSPFSEQVGTKFELRPVIKQTLNALALLLKANYPTTWREELRLWGFQKEKY